MVIPKNVQQLLHQLTARGYEAYAVGGCVRDTLLGRTPNDWDICTSALPEETEAVFAGYRVIETGLKHGTVTVMLENQPFEITTFRRDGTYADHRRPDEVHFVRSLREDLARRDFTVGAMAADEDGNIVDLFGGETDLQNRVICCVGQPEKRFEEDALRILRGLRFASQLGFSIHPDTARAMEEKKELLSFVSAERIYKELTKLLEGPDAAKVLRNHGRVLSTVLPEIVPAMGFLQKNPYHDRDVWGHTLKALAESPPDPCIRWALLLHDLGKPERFTVDENGVGHFYGHPQRGEEMAREIFTRLKADKYTRDTVCALIKYHDYDTPASEKTARRFLREFGSELLPQLLEVKRCDALAHADTPKTRARYENLMVLTGLVQEAMAQGLCCSLRELAIGGRELMALGVPAGPQIGQILNQLLEDVVEERCENRPDVLLRQARIYLESH